MVEQHSLPSTSEGKEGGAISILVVDDESAMVDAITSILSPLGYEILGTTDAREALDWFFQRLFHLSILDVHMPYMNGFEMFEKMSHVYFVPCIFITGDRTKELKMKALDLGAFAIIYKPFSPEVLKHTVQKALAQYMKKDMGGSV